MKALSPEDVAKLASARSDEVVIAQRDAALWALLSMLRAFDRLEKEFSTTPQQFALREARAVLVENGWEV